MDQISAHAFAAYRAMVYETDGFNDYFRATTVIDEIATLNIGSRPSARKSGGRIEDLRAIPWVFSWAQSRVMLPGWFAFGTAIDRWLEEEKNGLATLRQMYAEWPFFQSLLSNMDMVLAKSSMAIASRYADLATGTETAAAIFERLRGEHARTVARLLDITETDRLLASNPLLERSIRNRFPYIDPLNHLQVDLLRQNRAGSDDPKVARGILLTINGISAGLRNSG
ncbi:MAG: phosphoenolpyruvate carboxylase [Pseudomonadota bacterium]